MADIPSLLLSLVVGLSIPSKALPSTFSIIIKSSPENPANRYSGSNCGTLSKKYPVKYKSGNFIKAMIEALAKFAPSGPIVTFTKNEIKIKFSMPQTPPDKTASEGYRPR